MNRKLIILAASPVGDGLSGGDRIFIELARSAAKLNILTIVTSWKAGFIMCKRLNLRQSKYIKFIDLKVREDIYSWFILLYFIRILKSIIWSCAIKLSTDNSSIIVIYSASDFWMDVIPALILKLRFPQIIWAGTFYLAAPNPFKGYNEGGNWRIPTLKGVIYWLMQLPMYWAIRAVSQFVFVTSDPDIRRFPIQAKKGKVIVIKGGVDLQKINKYQKKIGEVEKKYDAVFMGRFHTQKGVLELIDIWNKVVMKLPGAKLIMIGDGPLMSEIRRKIQHYKLDKNIFLTGYLLDGIEKYTIFAKSKIVVHPAIYDSGGMAAAEAMAWGLPGVSFDLKALKTYYPKGMLKAPLHNYDKFALIVVRLLTEKKLYISEKNNARTLISNYWSWEKRMKLALGKIYG